MRKRHPSLADLVRDTPVKERSDIDELALAYLESRPPPAYIADKERELEDRLETPTGRHLLADILGTKQVYFEKLLADAITAERAAHDKARADKAEAELARKREWWDSLVKAVIGPLVVGVVCAVAGLIYELSKLLK